MTTQDDLKQIKPDDAYDMYIDDKEKTAAPSTVKSHEDRLRYFVDWVEEDTDYTYLRDLDGLDLRRWKIWRFDDDHSDAYIKGVQDTVRVFLRFCRDIEAVKETLPAKCPSPVGSKQRGNEIDADFANDVLEHLDRYQYATRDHVGWLLMWYGILRLGSVHSIDVDDVDLEDGYVELEHRPQTGTRLKNQYEADRVISIRSKTTEIIGDYIANNRIDAVGEEGREPLLTTEHGRPHRNTIRKAVYSWSRPCKVGRGCPHDRDPDECEAAQRRIDSYKCPSSESTHAIRRGSISWHLRQETPKTVISDRADVSPDILDEHYSTLTKREKADAREGYLPDDL